MRSVAFVLMAPLLACSASAKIGDQVPPDSLPPPTVDGGVAMAPPPDFQVMSPPVDIAPMTEATYCYYFHTSNTNEVSVRRWVSRMTAGVHDMILYLTPTDQQTPGSMLPTSCVVAKSSGGPAFSYAAQTPNAEAALPADDGTGNPVGQPIKAKQSGFVQIHYINSTPSAIPAHVELDAYAYPDSVQPTPAAPFVAFNLEIQIGPGSQATPATGMASGDCPLPLDPGGKPLQFFGLTTYTHKQGVHTFIKDGATKIFDSTSWEHPGTASWPTSPFYAFKSNTLTYQCEYSNPNSYTLLTGDSVTTAEMCMAIGYFFPAPAGSHLCLDSSMVF